MNEQDKEEKRVREQEEAVTPPVVRLAAAEVDAAAAKDRLNDTVARLQSKMDPKLIAKEATDEVRRAGDRGVVLAKENREALLGLAGGVILFLLRKPLLSIFKRRKYPKPQKAAKPMTATEPNKRLANGPHPTQPQPVAAPPVSTAHPTASATAPATGSAAAPRTTPAAHSNEGAPLQGSTL